MPRKYTKNPTIAWMADEIDTLEVLLQNWVCYMNGGTSKQRELQVVVDSEKFERVEVLCRMFSAAAKFRRAGLLQPQRQCKLPRKREVILGVKNAEKTFVSR